MIVLLLTVLLAQALTPVEGGIKGVVVAADTGTPIPGLTVVARSIAEARPDAPLPNPVSAKTDHQGAFEITGLRPDAYAIAVDGTGAQGYARQIYGSPQSGMMGAEWATPVVVSAGQTTGGIVIRLVKGGLIVGRILGANGEPFVDGQVSVHRVRYDASGRRSLIGEAFPVRVNDRGEYRFFGIDPGQIYLSAGPQPRLIVLTPGGQASRYAELTFYPRAATAAEADLIEIKPGTELLNTDIQLLPRPPVRSVLGRVLDSRTGQAPAMKPEFAIVPIDREVTSLRGYIPKFGDDGSFEITDVQQGQYWISAMLRAPIARPLPGEEVKFPPALIAFQRIDLRDADLNGLTLTFAPSVHVSGRIRLDGQPLSPSEGGTRVHVQLDTVRNNAFPMNMVPPPQPVAVDPDGAFTVHDVPQGEYRVKILGLPEGVYATEARAGIIDALSEPLMIGAAAPGDLEINLTRATGQIQGTVVDSHGQFVANVQVVLIPDNLRNRTDLYKRVTTDTTGHFAFRGVLPGDYKVFAWTTIESFRYFDPAYVARFETQGEPIRVEDSTPKTVTVNRIP